MAMFSEYITEGLHGLCSLNTSQRGFMGYVLLQFSYESFSSKIESLFCVPVIRLVPTTFLQKQLKLGHTVPGPLTPDLFPLAPICQKALVAGYIRCVQG